MNIGNWVQVVTLLLMIFTTGISQSEQQAEKYLYSSDDYSADYDGDGREEVFRYVSYMEGTELEQVEKPGAIEVWYIEEYQEPILVDSIETVDGYQGMACWELTDVTVNRYKEHPVMNMQLYLAGSNGWGYYRQIFYGIVDGEPIKIKDERGWGSYLSTTYMHDGSVNEVCDSEFLSFLEETGTEGVECDVNGDGKTDLFLFGNGYECIYEKTKAGIVSRFSWEPPADSVHYSGHILLEDGTVMTYYEIGETAFYGWVEEFYRFDKEWNVQKDVYKYLILYVEDLENAGEEEKAYLQENFFPDTDLATLESGYYVFLNGEQVEMVPRQED